MARRTAALLHRAHRAIAGRRELAATWLAAAVLASAAASAEPVRVRHMEGTEHVRLVLRTLSGVSLASGELVQVADGDEVTTRVVFRFDDGSLHDETAVFGQRQHFALVRDHLVQKGPSFPHPLEMSIDAAAGQVSMRYGNGGEEKTMVRRLDLPSDLANGIVLVLLKNIAANPAPTTVSLLAATPEPRLVQLAIGTARDGENSNGPSSAIHYVLKIKVGGISGFFAPLVGRQPPDIHVWILAGDPPVFLKAEQPLYVGGPLWRIESAGPMPSPSSIALQR